MATKSASEYFEVGAAGLPIVDTPVNDTPAESEVVGTQKPILVSKGYDSLYGRPQAAAEFTVFDATGTTIIQQSGVLVPSGEVPIESWAVPTDLALSTTFMWQHKFRSTFGEDYTESEKTSFSVPSASVGTPTITDPVTETTTTSLDVTVTATPFVALGAAQVHDETTLEVATDSGFLSIVQTIVKNSGDLTFVDVTLINPSTDYYLRIKYQGDTTGYSAVSPTVKVTSVTNTVVKPTVTYPDGVSGIQSFVTATSSAFAYEGAVQTHDAAEWELFDDVGLENRVFTSGLSVTSLTSVQITGLLESKSYYLRKRDQGSLSGLSEWSDTVSFTTASTFSNWSAWDGTADGVVQQSGTINSSEAQSSRLTADIGGGRYLVLTRADTSSTVECKVVSSLGLLLAQGAIESFSSSATQQKAAVIRLENDKVLLSYVFSTGFQIVTRVLTITGNSISVGAEQLSGLFTDHSEEWDISPVDSEHALVTFTDNNNADKYSAAILGVSGDTVTTGVVKDLATAAGGSYTRGSSTDVLGNKAICVRDGTAANTAVLEVISLDLGTDTVTSEANLEVDILTGNLRSLQASWLDEGNFVCPYLNSSATTLRGLVGTYDGASTVALSSDSEMMSANTGSQRDVATLVVSSDQIMTIGSNNSSEVFVLHSYVSSGNMFNGLPVIIDAGPVVSNLKAVDLHLMDANRIFAAWDGSATNNGVRNLILNGEEQ